MPGYLRVHTNRVSERRTVYVLPISNFVDSVASSSRPSFAKHINHSLNINWQDIYEDVGFYDNDNVLIKFAGKIY